MAFWKRNTLLELVFQDRNKAYGAYWLRKRYLKILIGSSVVGCFLVSLLFLIPFFAYLFEDSSPGDDLEYIYQIEYIPFAAPEDVDLVELARAHANKPQEKVLVPVVTDSIPPEEPEDSLTHSPEPVEEDTLKQDTASYGSGGDEIGREPTQDTIYTTTLDVYPRYPGGVEARLYYLRRNVVYPKEAVEEGIQGVVMVLFVVEPDGSITNISISKGIGGGCDEEAMRVTRNMPKWFPGKRGGHPVRVMIRMPIVFKLPSRSS